VNNVFIDFELKIQETGATVQLHTLPVLEASAQQMNQLFYNLISNALKFRKEKVAPVIDIAARRMEKKEVAHYSELDRSLTYYVVSVSDNGIGFSMKYAKHIFDIFKRLHTRSKFEGTGIGLALCRKIAINHKGDIFASSKEEEGSVFHVVLPQRQPVKG
jgi:light-regulated signal transduction histidine kinase (bacteriophytochrome)